MKIKSRNLILITTVVLAVGILTLWFNHSVLRFANEINATEPPAEDIRPPDQPADIQTIIARELNLTDLSESQIKTLQEMRLEAFREMNEFVNSIVNKKEEIQNELRADSIDKKKIDSIINEIVSLQKSMVTSRVKSIYRTREILTDEQWKNAKDKIFTEDFGPHFPGGPGGQPPRRR